VLKRLYNYAQVIKGKRNTKPWTTLYPALQITNNAKAASGKPIAITIR
jgi:hypothetical protein